MMPAHLWKVGDRVRIWGDHPHRGAAGTVKTPARDLGLVGVMVEIDLDEDGSGIDGCFAAISELRPLPRSEDPFA
jgi:hypothetical protein